MQRRRGKFEKCAVAHVLDEMGRAIACYLEKPMQGYELFTPSDPLALQHRRRRRVAACFDILPVSHPHLPAGRAESGGLQDHL
jgi:hypothetical protein